MESDCVIVGASFAGLASAHALATAGLRVTVVEKKSDPGAKLHTTGIIVKDAVDQVALLDSLPGHLVRRIPGVRLYAPNLRFVDLAAPGYYFLATDTPNVMRWLASDARRAGAREPRGWRPDAAMAALLAKIAPAIDLRGVEPTSVRAGLIPCGGIVRPVAAPRVLLVGDAAGMVSPVTAGGIHTALKHGRAAGNAVVDFLRGRADDPSSWFVRTYPRFRAKRLLRWAFDHLQTDFAFNWLLGTQAMRRAAGIVYFHHKGVFDPGAERSALETPHGERS